MHASMQSLKLRKCTEGYASSLLPLMHPHLLMCAHRTESISKVRIDTHPHSHTPWRRGLVPGQHSRHPSRQAALPKRRILPV